MFKSLLKDLYYGLLDFIVNTIAGLPIIPRIARFYIYRMFGIKTETFNIYPRNVFGAGNVKIGRGSFINHGCFFDASAMVEIGENVSIGMEVMFCTSSHKINHTTQRAGEGIAKPIKIGNGCWIGTRAVILPGVIVGDGCVIAAGSVVTKDCEPNSLYAGVPARKVNNL